MRKLFVAQAAVAILVAFLIAISSPALAGEELKRLRAIDAMIAQQQRNIAKMDTLHDDQMYDPSLLNDVLATMGGHRSEAFKKFPQFLQDILNEFERLNPTMKSLISGGQAGRLAAGTSIGSYAKAELLNERERSKMVIELLKKKRADYEAEAAKQEADEKAKAALKPALVIEVQDRDRDIPIPNAWVEIEGVAVSKTKANGSAPFGQGNEWPAPGDALNVTVSATGYNTARVVVPASVRENEDAFYLVSLKRNNDIVTGEYDVQLSNRGAPHEATWMLTITGNHVEGKSYWDADKETRTKPDPLVGSIVGYLVFVTRDCRPNSGLKTCSQTYTAELQDDGSYAGMWSGTGAKPKGTGSGEPTWNMTRE